VSYFAPDTPPPAPPSGKGQELLSALVITVAVAVGGVVLGLVWYLLAPPLPLKKVQGGLAFTSPQPEELVAQDGLFAILGFVFGVLAAVAAWTLARRWRGPVQLFALLLGAIGAGFLAWQVGTQIDQDGYRETVAASPMGTTIERPIELSASSTKTCLAHSCVTTRGGDILVPALGSVIAYAVLAGWSRWPSLRRQEEQEGLVQGGGWPELGEARRDGPDLP
jgi:Protein of unknown function (DUF2567)